MKRTILFFLSCLILGCAPSPDHPTDYFDDEAQIGIIGGQKTEPTSDIARSTVFVDLVKKVDGKDMRTSCSGVIVNPTTILTAAHCVYIDSEKNTAQVQGEPVKAYIRFGSDMTNIKTIPYILANQIITHPQFQSQKIKKIQQYDIAILKLSSPVPAPYKPVRILPDFSLIKIQAPVIAVGYGQTDQQGISPLIYLKHVIVPVRGIAFNYIETRPTDSDTTCHGDSGGPMFLNFKGTIYLVGTLSSGRKGSQGQPCGGVATYTRLDFIRDFLSPHIKWDYYPMDPVEAM